jgi:hypothetical protein
VAKEWMPKPGVSAYGCICNKNIKENMNAGFEETQRQPDCIGWNSAESFLSSCWLDYCANGLSDWG